RVRGGQVATCAYIESIRIYHRGREDRSRPVPTLKIPVLVETFKILGYPLHELSTQGAVHHPVIVTVGEEHFVPNPDDVAFRSLYYGRHLSDSSKSKDGHLRLINYGSPHNTSKSSNIGHRIRPSLNIVRFQLIGPGPVSQVIYSFSHSNQV